MKAWLIFFALALFVRISGAGELVGPMVQWKSEPATSATILWLEKEGAANPQAFSVVASSKVGAALAPVPAMTRSLGSSKHAVHSVDFTGLTPEMDCTISILSNGKESAKVKFRTAPAEPGPGFRFVTGGDMFHKRNLLDAMNRRAGELDPVFALLVGDLAYANNKDDARWLEWLDSWAKCAVTPDGRAVPMTVAIGNHEVEGAGFKPTDAPPPSKADMYYSLFKPGAAHDYQALDFGKSLSFILLDSGHTANISAQTAWLANALKERQAVPRLMVGYHRPAWGSGIKEDAVDIQKEWCPLFEKAKVDVVFENDHHGYKRTYPMTRGKRDDEAGIPYLGDGAWGVAVREAPPKELAKRPWLVKAAATNHLFLVTLTEGGFRYEAMTADGKVFDSVVRPLRRANN
ncbi:MAG: metallophosphoesterase [Verrucomicrobiales bacterium]